MGGDGKEREREREGERVCVGLWEEMGREGSEREEEEEGEKLATIHHKLYVQCQVYVINSC